VYLLLQPRRFKYKVKQKNRIFRHFNKNNNLHYGDAGLMLLRPIQLTANHLFRLKLFLKKAVRKVDRTRRFVWFQAFPHLPLTKKPDGLRMGKGKGKLACWFTTVTGGTLLFEFKNLRYGRTLFFMKQVSHKLGIQTKTIFASNLFFNFPLKISRKIFFRTFW